MRFPGHAPIRPVLQYLKKEISIINRIAMRMDLLSPLQQRISIEMIHSSGMKVKDAGIIDAMFKAMKITGHAAILLQAQSEARGILEYEIEF